MQNCKENLQKYQFLRRAVETKNMGPTGQADPPKGHIRVEPWTEIKKYADAKYKSGEYADAAVVYANLLETPENLSPAEQLKISSNCSLAHAKAGKQP